MLYNAIVSIAFIGLWSLFWKVAIDVVWALFGPQIIQASWELEDDYGRHLSKSRR